MMKVEGWVLSALPSSFLSALRQHRITFGAYAEVPDVGIRQCLEFAFGRIRILLLVALL